jgi:hypothetical protein
MGYVSYADLFQYTMMLISFIGLIYNIWNHKKK